MSLSCTEVCFKHHSDKENKFQEAQELFFLYALTLSIQHLPFYTLKFKVSKELIALTVFNVSIHNVNTAISFRCYNEKCLEENTMQRICGFVWSSLILAGLTLLLLFLNFKVAYLQRK